jgi:probable rRNA maturation factor
MFERLVRALIKREKAAGRIDVSLVNDRQIRQLNRRFRRRDKATDVLAFPYGPGQVRGDVIIARETTRRNARRFGVPYRAELKRLVIHGALHVLGYDHGRKMSHAEKIYEKL